MTHVYCHNDTLMPTQAAKESQIIEIHQQQFRKHRNIRIKSHDYAKRVKVSSSYLAQSAQNLFSFIILLKEL